MRLARPASRVLLGAALLVIGGPRAAAVRAQASRTTDTPRGAIVGRILDNHGAPFAGALVDALVTRNDRGVDGLVSIATAHTDDRGEFRLADLPPGLYYVSATDPAKDAELYASTYAPGTQFASDAQPVRITATADPARLEFRLTPTRLARVSGQLIADDSHPLLNGVVTMSPTQGQGAPIAPPRDITILPDGRFTFRRVAPGHYQIRARGQTDTAGALFAVFGVLVNGEDLEGIRMTLRPGARLDGTLTVDATRHTAPPPLSTLTVRAPFTDGDTFGDVPTGVVQPDGSFAIRGIMTGEHEIVVEGLRPPWVVRQISLHGAEATDVPLDVVERQHFDDVRIIVTDDASELSGTVRNTNGDPVAKAGVLVFSVASSFWMRTSRRVRVTFTDGAGRFSIDGLPAGEYLAAASMAIDASDLGRRRRLQAYASIATPVTLTADDGRASVDLRLTTAPPAISGIR